VVPGFRRSNISDLQASSTACKSKSNPCLRPTQEQSEHSRPGSYVGRDPTWYSEGRDASSSRVPFDECINLHALNQQQGRSRGGRRQVSLSTLNGSFHFCPADYFLSSKPPIWPGKPWLYVPTTSSSKPFPTMALISFSHYKRIIPT